MAILTKSGRTAMAQAVMAQPIHFAWGSGDAAWDDVYAAEDINAVALLNEIGRREATSLEYVIPDENGTVEVPLFNDPDSGNVTKLFTVVGYPTGYLYMRFNFDFADAPASEIREVAVFMNTTTQVGLPIGQKYFISAEVTNPGTLLALENLREKIIRSPNSRQSFEFVLTI